MPSPPRNHLRVEVLEDRLTPSAITTSTNLVVDPPVYVWPQAVNQTETEPNDTLAQANTINLNYYWIYANTVPPVSTATTAMFFPYPYFSVPQVGGIAGSLDNTANASDVDDFTFTVDAQQKISLTLSGDAVTNGATLQLLDADGNVLATGQVVPISPVADGSSAVDQVAETTLSYYTAAGGTFYVRVGSADGAATPASGAYTLNVSSSSDYWEEHEPNDTLDQANPIQMEPMFYPMIYSSYYYPWFLPQQNGYITGSLDNTVDANDTDFFSLTSDPQRKITLTLTGDAADSGALVQLLDADGNVLATSSTGSLSYYTNAGGTFHVEVGTPAGATHPAAGAYNLSVNVAADPYEEHEPNDSFDTANALQMSSGFLYPIPLAASSSSGTTLNTVAAPSIAFPIWNPYGEQDGYVTGELDTHADGSADVDYFSFYADTNHNIHAALSGDLASNGGRITLYDANQNELASDAAAVDYLTTAAGTYYIRIDQPDPASAADPTATQYRVDVTTKLNISPVQGPDETEPNDTMAQANSLPLQDVWADDGSGVTLRSGAALGIAGGPTNDVDYFQFDIKAGEHVQVGVDGFVCDPNGGVFTSIADWIKGDHIHVGKNSVAALLKANPGVEVGNVQVTIYDSQGNQIGASSDDGTSPGEVTFDAPADGTYYAEITTTVTSLVHYRLSVSASSGEAATPGLESVSAQNFVKVLHVGQSIDFTDASGQRVHVAYQSPPLLGPTSHRADPSSVTITFTGPHANGSDIASIVINNGHGGKLTIQSKGSTRVGSLTIHGMPQKTGNSAFGQIQISGNLGTLASDANIGSVSITGTLGSVSMPGEKIGTLKAQSFDSALVQAANAPVLQIHEDPNTSALATFATVIKNAKGGK